MNEPLPNLLRRAAHLMRSGGRGVLCLVVGARGATPQEAGALMLVDDAAMSFGTIGGGCVEAEVRRRAFDLLGRGGSGALRFKLNHDYGWDDGLICGGTLEVVVASPSGAAEIDRIVAEIGARRATHVDLRVEGEGGGATYRLHVPARERLYIAGAGHVGQAVARLGLGLEFEVRVFDDRADLLDAALPVGAAGVAGPIEERLREAAVDGRTYCLVVTRGHRHDERALAAVVGRGAAYVGMIGSRRKVKLIRDDLLAMGVPPGELDGVHAPVGLDIGAVSVEEIAVSIAAQLVQVRRRSAERVVERVAGVDLFAGVERPGGADAPDAAATLR